MFAEAAAPFGRIVGFVFSATLVSQPALRGLGEYSPEDALKRGCDIVLCVSTVNQNLALQRDALTEAGCDRIFTEQMSSAVADRPAVQRRADSCRAGRTAQGAAPSKARGWVSTFFTLPYDAAKPHQGSTS